jgi:N-acetylated-alpha-linked acidic dipeptidase
MLEEIMLLTPQEEQARAHSEYYTSGPHLGGKNLSQAIYTRELWESYGIQSEIVTYDIYTNYPKSHRLGLLQAKSSNSTIGTSEIIDGRSYGLLYEAGLAEDVLQDDPTTGLDDRIPTFHGYSSK